MHNVRVCRLRLRLLFRLQCALPMLDTNTSMGVSFVAFGEEINIQMLVYFAIFKRLIISQIRVSKLNVPFGCGPLGLKLHINNLIDTEQHQRTHVL